MSKRVIQYSNKIVALRYFHIEYNQPGLEQINNPKPIYSQCTLFLPPENIRKPQFSDVFRGQRNGALGKNGLRQHQHYHVLFQLSNERKLLHCTQNSCSRKFKIERRLRKSFSNLYKISYYTYALEKDFPKIYNPIFFQYL